MCIRILLICYIFTYLFTDAKYIRIVCTNVFRVHICTSVPPLSGNGGHTVNRYVPFNRVPRRPIVFPAATATPLPPKRVTAVGGSRTENTAVTVVTACAPAWVYRGCGRTTAKARSGTTMEETSRRRGNDC